LALAARLLPAATRAAWRGVHLDLAGSLLLGGGVLSLLLHPQLAHTPGYVPGLAIGSLYFLGFTGIWLVLALSFQDGLGYSRFVPAWPLPRSRSGWPPRRWSPVGWLRGWGAG
jgi:hypothetical protein